MNVWVVPVVLVLIVIHFSSHYDNIGGGTTPAGLFMLWDYIKEKLGRREDGERR